LEKITFIVNPASGRSLPGDIKNRILRVLDTKKFEPEILFSSEPGEATAIASERQTMGNRIIVAVGGDGTVNEIAKSLINTDTLLAIVPAGSGNGLARHLGIPTSLEKAVRIINRMKWKEIDYATVNGQPYFCTSGVGFDARIGNLFAKNSKRGFIAYVKIILKEFFRYRPEKYSIELNGEQIVREAFLITVANGSQYGNNAYIAPDAQVEDGLLNFCIVSKFPGFRVWELGIRMVIKKLPSSKYYEVFKVKHAKISSLSQSYMHFDGEPGGKGNKFEYQVFNKKLKVIIPSK
jgi:YegS/Rv2252/BmrU family lipid kinase